MTLRLISSRKLTALRIGLDRRQPTVLAVLLLNLFVAFERTNNIAKANAATNTNIAKCAKYWGGLTFDMLNNDRVFRIHSATNKNNKNVK